MLDETIEQGARSPDEQQAVHHWYRRLGVEVDGPAPRNSGLKRIGQLEPEPDLRLVRERAVADPRPSAGSWPSASARSPEPLLEFSPRAASSASRPPSPAFATGDPHAVVLERFAGNEAAHGVEGNVPSR
jgi:hypothetical protein